jgi:transposase
MYSSDFIFMVLRQYHARKELNLSISQLLKIARISRSTLFEWIKQYSDNSEFSHINYESSSRPPERQFQKTHFPKKINDTCLRYIIDIVLEKQVINANNICKNIKRKFNVIISKNYLYKILADNNITYKVAQKNSYPDGQDKLEQQKRHLRSVIESVDYNLNYTDEFSAYFYVKPDHGWSKKGKRCIISQPYTYSNKSSDRFSVAMTMTSEKIINYSVVRGSFNAKRFKRYLSRTIPKSGDTTFFMDGAKTHSAKIVKQFMSKCKKRVIFNVPYCPQFNPIEFVFNTIKRKLYMKTFQSESCLRRFLDSFIKKINKDGLLNYCVHALKNLYD